MSNQDPPEAYPRGIVDKEYHGAVDRPKDRNDLADPGKTQQATINALGWEHAHGAPPITITSINSSHHDDSGLGTPGVRNHGHTNGFSLDVVLNDPRDLNKFLGTLAENPYVTKIGLGGEYYSKDALRHTGDRFVFKDNDQTHVHFQTTESGNRAPTLEETVRATVKYGNETGRTNIPEPRDVRPWDGKQHLGTVVKVDENTYAMHVGRGSYQTLDVQRDLHGQHPTDGRKLELDGRGHFTEDRTIAPQQTR